MTISSAIFSLKNGYRIETKEDGNLVSSTICEDFYLEPFETYRGTETIQAFKNGKLQDTIESNVVFYVNPTKDENITRHSERMFNERNENVQKLCTLAGGRLTFCSAMDDSLLSNCFQLICINQETEAVMSNNGMIFNVSPFCGKNIRE